LDDDALQEINDQADRAENDDQRNQLGQVAVAFHLFTPSSIRRIVRSCSVVRKTVQRQPGGSRPDHPGLPRRAKGLKTCRGRPPVFMCLKKPGGSSCFLLLISIFYTDFHRIKSVDDTCLILTPTRIYLTANEFSDNQLTVFLIKLDRKWPISR
jgi:hypothetical protein